MGGTTRAVAFAFLFAALWYLQGCIPVDERGVRVEQGNPVRRDFELLIEELDTVVDQASGRQRIPAVSDPDRYIDAAGMHIGALYSVFTDAQFRPCVERYTAYLLGAADPAAVASEPGIHVSLSRRIAEIGDLTAMPVSTRIGKANVNRNGTTALMPIIVVTESGQTMGELECRLESDRWQLYNFVIDIERLRDGTAESLPQFNPLLF